MIALPPEWEAYSRLQYDLDNRPTLDRQTAAIESAMTLMLERPAGLTPAETTLVIQSTHRRERRHNALMAKFGPRLEDDISRDPLHDIEIRDLYAKAQAIVPPTDWAMFAGLATGHTNQDLAALDNVSAGAFNARVCRARTKARTSLATISDFAMFASA